MSRPRRLPALRLARIGGWTAVATAGVAVAMTRFSGPAEVPAAPAVEPAPATGVYEGEPQPEVENTGPGATTILAGVVGNVSEKVTPVS